MEVDRFDAGKQMKQAKSTRTASAKAAARSARLRYVNPDEPGIVRRRRGRGFSYEHPNGHRVGRADRARIERLAVPPAWTRVWICANANGHIQATGRDARGRKQYRYHDEWRRVRDENKYDHLLDFAERLPRIRARIARGMGEKTLSKERVVAALVHLLDLTHVRVGNEEYARANQSFGLTTARNHHVNVGTSRIRLAYRGKGGAPSVIELADRRLARIVARCQDLPGQRLFAWVDDEGQVHPVDSSDVNRYLRETTGADITAKDFRTWAATLSAVCTLERLGPRVRKPQREKIILEAVRGAAMLLGNTPAVCRRSYIHPEPLDAYLTGTFCESLAACRAHKGPRGLSADERMLCHYLRRGRRQQ